MRRLALTALLLLAPGSPALSQQQAGALQAVLANGYRFAYAESGAGRPVILVHGALSDYRFWDSLRAAGSDSIHFIAYSRRYHAPNPWRPDDPPAGYEASAADLAAMIRALRLEKPVLVGHSWGGGVVLQAALRFPELIGGVVLAEPVADSMIEDSAYRAQVADWTRRTYAEALARDPGRQPEIAARVLFDAWRGEDAWSRLSPRDREQLSDNAHTLRSSASPQPAVSCAHVGRLHVPMLLVGGGQSPLRFRTTLDGLASCLPEARRDTIPEAGHRFPSTHAAGFHQILTRFLATLPR
ncbi:MAG: alpha/beta hydrolase [Gemmatimonadota bacterium]|nr:alpha/beta hydrolase [Gemmatimonadota bacterium]